jgi:hypothetical protein
VGPQRHGGKINMSFISLLFAILYCFKHFVCVWCIVLLIIASAFLGPDKHLATFECLVALCSGHWLSFPGVKWPGNGGFDHSPLLASRLKKERSYTCTTPGAFMACSRENFNFNFTGCSVVIVEYVTS